MIKREVTIVNSSGLQVETAGVLCEKALKFQSHIEFSYRGDNVANAKSVLSILGAGIRKGETITLCAKGDDEVEAIDAIEKLIISRFED